jgi:hypothetical protein
MPGWRLDPSCRDVSTGMPGWRLDPSGRGVPKGMPGWRLDPSCRGVSRGCQDGAYTPHAVVSPGDARMAPIPLMPWCLRGMPGWRLDSSCRGVSRGMPGWRLDHSCPLRFSSFTHSIFICSLYFC